MYRSRQFKTAAVNDDIGGQVWHNIGKPNIGNEVNLVAAAGVAVGAAIRRGDLVIAIG